MDILINLQRFIIGSTLILTFSLAFPITAKAANGPIWYQQYAKTFIYNPRTLKWKAINNNGKVVKTGRGSGGRNYCPDIGRRCRTPSGTYHIVSKRGAYCKSSRYPKPRGGAPMPYCMFFNKNYAIHGSNDVPNYNASHGCIRVRTNDARWLYNNFMSIGTKVIIKSY